MRLPQLQRPLQAAVMAGGYRPVLAGFALPTRPAIPTAQTLRVGDGGVDGRRYASVKSQGAYRIPNKKTIAKKLGAKRSGDQFVIPGNIIFKQRGTIWHAGFNAIRGRDHTIHAAATGYVKYYRDPSLHPDKQYIGVAFNKEDKLPYPKNEPRRRKLGMVAHVRKTGAGPRPAISDSGIPNRVLRKAGLYNIEVLERRLWNAEKSREIKEAEARNAKAAKLAMAGLSATTASPAPVTATPVADASSTMTTTTTNTSVETPPAVIDTAGVTSPDAFANAVATKPRGTDAEAPPAVLEPPVVTSPDAFATAVATKTSGPAYTVTKKRGRTIYTPKGMSTGQPEPAKAVTTGEFLQKSWQERRRTKVLLLNPRNYSYAESNAAIGRLSSKTMYTPPWKLGGRKSRFRSRHKRMVAKIVKRKSDKALVRAEREKERIAQEKKRAEKLAKQRARGRKAEEQAAAAAAEKQAAQAAEVAAAPEAQASESSAEVKEAANTAETQQSAEPVLATETEKPIEAKETAQPTETKESSQAVEAKQTEDAVAKEEEKPVVATKTEEPREIDESDKPDKP
ncbi:unnamed protein product [Discula destructiva]